MHLLRHLRPLIPIERYRNPPPRVAVVRLAGIIGRIGPLRAGIDLARLNGVLERAFKLDDGKAVALAINSPGGSPVQAALIGRRIRALAAEHRRPVLAFAEDVAASGGYWLAAAADEIFADACSIIGSIGVISAGFGFPEALKRIGVERRVYVAGVHKDAFDPFQEERADEIEHLRAIQADIHAAFKEHVRARRGDKLRGSEDELFSGRFWTGRAALDLGLIDGLGDLRSVLEARYGEKVRLTVIADGRPWWQRLGFGRSHVAPPADAATVVAWGALAAVEERVMWSRYGR